jgi:hypothetical protein
VARNTTPPAGVFARARDGRARDAPTRRPRARHRTTRRDATGRDGTTGERVKASEIVDASSADVDVGRRDATRRERSDRANDSRRDAFDDSCSPGTREGRAQGEKIMKEAAKRAKTTAMKAARRPRSAARAMAVAATMGGEGGGGTELRAFVAACANALGRRDEDVGARIAATLEANWFTTPMDLARLSVEEARAMAVPMKLVDEFKRALDGARGFAASGASATTTTTEKNDEGETALDLGLEPLASETAATTMKTMVSSSGRMALKMRTGLSAESTRVTSRPVGLPNYRIPLEECGSDLKKQFKALRKFLTVRRLGPQECILAGVTAEKYEDVLRGALGWLCAEKNMKPSKVTLLDLFPSIDAESANGAFEYVTWLNDERQTSANYELLVTRSCIAAVKFLYGNLSKAQPGEGEAKPYHDLPVMKELRRMAKDAKARSAKAPSVSDERLKWLEWDEYLTLVQRLKSECTAKNCLGQSRSASAVAWSVQKYLIFGILSCVPDRQRTLRELRVGKTLFKEGDKWVIRHKETDYKTGKDYGVRPPLVIAPHLYPTLETFIETHRKELNPNHDFLFTRKNGEQFDGQGIYRLFTTTAMRLTGKRTNPHLIRDMVVTHLRGTDASERQLEALAIYMGHSLQMQKSTYDRRSVEQKVAPAVDLLDSLNAKMRL